MVDYITEYQKLTQNIKNANFDIETNENLINLKRVSIINQYLQKIDDQIQNGQLSPQEGDNLKKETTDKLNNAFRDYTELRISLIKNPDQSQENINKVHYLLKDVCPELEQIDTYIEEIAMAQINIVLWQEQLSNLQVTPTTPEPDSCQQLDNLQSKIDQEIKNNIEQDMDEYKGHLYPIKLVVGWTQALKDINSKIDNYINSLEEVDLEVVDKTWLRKNIKNFVDWISTKLKDIRQRIVKGIKSMHQGCTKMINDIIKILPTSLSLDSIVGWASNVIALFTKPYQTAVLFIKDFSTYTPPLIKETGILASNIVKTPGAVLTVLAKLADEEGKEIQEEATKELSKISFEPISIGELQ